MDFFDRHKALIITVLIFSILILSMYNINISNESKKIRETLIELNDLRPEPIPEEQPQPEPEEPKPPTPQQKPSFETHQAYNQNREESQSNLDSRLEEIFQKNAAQQEASEEEANETSSGDMAVSNTRSPRKPASEGDNSSKETSVKKGSMRNSSISFSLMGRTAVDIPNPIYTCDRSGKVVINITVNALGNVIKTSVNKSASSTNNECLTDMAQEYAVQARFSRQPGRDSQPGTITYNFQN